MSNAKDIVIELITKDRELVNGQTQEKFTSTTFEGYALYKGGPIYKVRGKRIADRTHTNKETGKPFTISKIGLSFYNGEELDEELRIEGTLYLRLDEKTNRSKGNKFFTVTSEDYWYGKDDKRNTKGLKIGNLHIPLNGIIENSTIVDQWGDKANKLKLSADSKYSLGLITKDMMASDDKRVGYVASTGDELFTPEELTLLKKQFKYYDRFRGIFDGTTKEVVAKEKILAAPF